MSDICSRCSGTGCDPSGPNLGDRGTWTCTECGGGGEVPIDTLEEKMEAFDVWRDERKDRE
jgi:DnaJ-class molecular chaperone